jgi:hypothetical protein
MKDRFPAKFIIKIDGSEFIVTEEAAPNAAVFRTDRPVIPDNPKSTIVSDAYLCAACKAADDNARRLVKDLRRKIREGHERNGVHAGQ